MAITKVTRNMLNTGIVDNSNATAITIDSSEQVGIGTASPAQTLHTSGTGVQRIQVDATDNNAAGAGLYMKVLNSGSLVGNATIRVDNVGNLDFFNGTSSESEKMTIQSDGRVGIGATPSDYWGTANGLVVRESDNSTGITIATSTSNTGQIYFADGTSGDARYRGWLTYAHGTDTMSLATAASTKVTIDSSGKVGIGTTSPSETLHVKRADGTALIVESSNDQNNTGDRINIEFRTDAAQGIAKIIGGKEGNYQGSSTRSGYLAFQTINANSYAERMRINSSGFTSVSNDPNYIASDQAGLQVERGGLLIHGTSLSTNFHTANHHGNYWTFIGSAGASGSYAGNFRISVPNPEGTVGTAWGGLQLEIYISGYNAKFCHAILSGYTNGGVTLSESTIIRSSGSHSISYGNYHTAGGSSNQGFYFDVDIPAYVHPAVFFRITRAGDASAGKETSMKNLKIEWS